MASDNGNPPDPSPSLKVLATLQARLQLLETSVAMQGTLQEQVITLQRLNQTTEKNRVENERLNSLLVSLEPKLKELDVLREDSKALFRSHEAEFFVKIEELDRVISSKMSAWEEAVKTKTATDSTGTTWSQKAKRHQFLSTFYFGIFIFIIISMGFLFFNYAIPEFRAIDQSTVENGYTEYALKRLFFALSLIVPVLLGVWGLRIIIRLFFAERSLDEDARERKAMLDTFIGLTADKEFLPEHRLVALQALFRHRDNSAIDDASPMKTIETLANAIAKIKR